VSSFTSAPSAGAHHRVYVLRSLRPGNLSGSRRAYQRLTVRTERQLFCPTICRKESRRCINTVHRQHDAMNLIR
jgi:hypothetical protein